MERIRYMVRTTSQRRRSIDVILSLFAGGLVLFSVCRAALFLPVWGSLQGVDRVWHLFLIGMRFDTMVLCCALVLPTLMLVLLPNRLPRTRAHLLAAWVAMCAAGFLFLEIATRPYFAEFGLRPDRLVIEHLQQPREVLGMIWTGYREQLLLGIALAAGTAAALYFAVLRWSCRRVPAGLRQRVAVFVIVAPVLFLGIRSSLSHRPLSISAAAFSTSAIANQLALNSTYTLGYAWYQLQKHEATPEKLFGRMESGEMLQRVAGAAGVNLRECTNREIPLLHQQSPVADSARPCNIVIILEESLGAEYVGCLGGLRLTPRFDELSRHGLLLTNLYCTGTRTVRGIEAVISGFLPSPGSSVVKLASFQRNFFTLADLLQRQGYTAEFIYGGRSTFDNMRAFFLGNGFTRIYDEASFEKPVFRGSWGVSDEDLFRKAHEIFLQHGSKPFFALLLSTSNHDPFEFPAGRIETGAHDSDPRLNAIRYADYALGMFFNRARTAPYFPNTVFLVIADHSTRLRGQDLIPLQKFHIPGLLIAPGVSPARCGVLASQIDMVPTLLDAAGLETEHPVPGYSLLHVPDGIAGRAVLQYGMTNAFLTENRLAVLQPRAAPRQFSLSKATLREVPPEDDLVRTARAHALLPGCLCRQGTHRLR